MRVCPECLTEYPSNEAFCINDGAKTQEAGGPKTPAPRTVALTKRSTGPEVASTVMMNRTPAPRKAEVATKTPAPIALSRKSQPTGEGNADDLIGQMVGSYKVKGRLGEGGMGAVYLGEHPGIGSKVAIKVLHRQFNSDTSVVDRFFAEARAANLIGHDNIVKIIDFNHLPDGRHFFVMEFLEGKPLAALVPHGALPLQVTGPILLQICDALQAAHEKSIIHRDLKPDNVFLVVRNRRKHFVKVVDFGVAKLGPLSGNVNKTATGIVLGTPTYMAPEQAMGNSASVGPRSDIYSLGCIMYQLATGRLAFEGSNFVELAIQHIQKEPDPPRELNPQISERYQAVILKTLRKKPEDRQANMGELSAEIAECMKAEGVAFELPPMDAKDDEILSQGPRMATPGQRSLNVAAPRTPSPRTPPPRVTLEEDEVDPTVLATRSPELKAAAAQLKRTPAPRSVDAVDQEISEVALGKKSKTGVWIALSVVVLGAAGAGAWWAMKGRSAAPPPEPPPVVAQEPAAPAPPAEVTLSVVSSPLGAKYTATWEGGKASGVTPAQLKIKDGVAVQIAFEKEGFKPAQKSVLARDEDMVSVELLPEPRKVERAPEADKPPAPEKPRKKVRMGNESLDVDL